MCFLLIYMDNPVTMVLDSPLSVITAPLLSFVIAFFSISGLIKSKIDWVLDHPNSRSLHSVPVPRIGGLGLLCGVVITWLLFSAPIPIMVWIGISLLVLISLMDDIWHLPIWCRLLIQSVVAASLSIVLLLDTYGWITVLCTAGAVIWMSNLYNFMDGSDGLAGGMTVIGFGYYGLFAYWVGNYDFAVINFSIAAAAMAFLLHNFYPARIFLGDVGAIPLGFLAAVFGILGWLDNLWSFWLPLLIFSPFIADATVTIIKRLLRGERIWQAHREHYYQRIVQSGFGHRNTALAAYALMLAVGGSAVWAGKQDLTVQHWMTAIWGGIYLVLMFISDWNQKYYSGRE
ncbi:glycosyltransferase family 4 protein [Nitrosomonas sp. Nm166]|uniref:MraY family glycosyltransferase n=1 Tax=Nitrosomonas sp. Nm166 TaxID=1881054 RepID=UPI0008EA9E2C|nr:glycosyltransferase family 4 protein [Nitrosomonas sp. Nm166]SFE46864.1 UDP-N-acetylmuramyl pentapeptide phosphotransferase/UDP-N-acetylglucosamine-1-phosphate transferase [Nitrosomonas sp. Nm166]